MQELDLTPGSQTHTSADLGTRVMALALAGLFAAGATLTLLMVALPLPAHPSRVALLVIIGDAYLISLALARYAPRVRRSRWPASASGDC